MSGRASRVAGAKRRRRRRVAPSLYVLADEDSWERDDDWRRRLVRAAATEDDGGFKEPAERMEDAVLAVLQRLLQEPMKRSRIASALDVTQDQARVMLRWAVALGALKTLPRPQRFQARQIALPGSDLTLARGPASGRALAPVLRRSFLAAALPLLWAPVSAAQVASELGLTTWQAKRWLDRLVADGAVAPAPFPFQGPRRGSNPR